MPFKENVKMELLKKLPMPDKMEKEEIVDLLLKEVKLNPLTHIRCRYRNYKTAQEG